jgi:DNA-binding NarL/FixJ family response regulator
MFRGSPLRSVQHAGCGTPARSGGQLRLERLLRAAQGVELLSERELGVIRLLGTDLDGPDIARQLVVSLNTVGTHTKNIYAKLGVNNRRAAVRRAQELDLLSRNPRPTTRSAVVRDARSP